MSEGGAIRFGPYQLERQIGSGGMAEVYLAHHDAFAHPVALKRPLPEFVQNRAICDLLQAEAAVTSALSHDNIVRVYDHGAVDGVMYLALEYLEGIDLLELLARCTASKRRLPTDLVCYIVAEVCRGLAHAHEAKDSQGKSLELVHRDISPSNIFLTRKGEVKIMDFGVARTTLNPQTRTEERNLRGKLGYMSPEQVVGRPLDKRSDIFSLGVVFYESLTLKRLFLGQSDAQTLLNIRDAEIEKRFLRHNYVANAIFDILRKALARAPEDRFQHATELREAILDYLFEARRKVVASDLAQFMESLDIKGGQRVADFTPLPSEDDEGPDPRTLSTINLRSARFQLRHDEGEPSAQIDFKRLVSLLSQRAIGPREWIAIDGAPWMRVEDIPALHELEPDLFESFTTRPVDDGPIHELSLPKTLFHVYRSRLTGLLRIRHKSVQKDFYFEKGKLIHSHSNLRSELIEQALFAKGLLTPESYQASLEYLNTHPGNLGHALLALGLLAPTQLSGALEALHRERLVQVCKWREGWFELHEGMLPPHSQRVPLAPPQTDTLAEALLQVVREALTPDELNALFLPMANRAYILGRPDEAAWHAFGFDSVELDALRSLYATTSIAAAKKHGGSRAVVLYRVAYALYLVGELGFRAATS